VSVSVLVSAQGGESLNGISARVNFPTDKLTLLSISKAGSIVTFWAEEPSFSNSAGTASLEGIVPNPGYSGQGGRVITFVFQVKAPGTATLSFGSASVLANDGRGTNVLTSAGPRTLSLASPVTPAVEPSVPVSKPKPVPMPKTEEVGQPDITDETATTSASVEPALSEVPTISTGVAREFSPFLILILAVIGLVALALAGAYGISRFLYGERMRRLAQGDVVHRSFGLLRKDLNAHLARLKRLPDSSLTKKEIDFIDQFEKDLADVESIVEKKLKTQK
jgi:nitrate reductase NapE component